MRVWLVAVGGLIALAAGCAGSERVEGDSFPALNDEERILVAEYLEQDDQLIWEMRQLEARWTHEAGFREITRASLASLRDELAEGMKDPEGVLEPGDAARLAAKTVERIDAATRPTPDRYLALMREEGHELVGAARGNLVSVYEYEFGGPPAGLSVREQVERMWGRLMRDKGYALGEIGSGPLGVAAAAATAGSVAETMSQNAVEEPLETTYWYGCNCFPPLAYHPQRAGLEAALEARDEVVIATTTVMVRLRNGRMAHMDWHWRLEDSPRRWVSDGVHAFTFRLVRHFY